MRSSIFYDEILPLPINAPYSVLIYYAEEQGTYRLEVLKKRGMQILHGGKYYPKCLMGENLDNRTVKRLKVALSFDFDFIKKHYEKEYFLVGAREFVNLISGDTALEKLMLDVRFSSRLSGAF
jgi:hypothetical protein